MRTFLALIIFLLVGFVGAKGWTSRVRPHFVLSSVFVTGLEFFFIGILLGPQVLNVVTLEVREALKPLIYLALGWTGLLFGIQLKWIQLKRVSGSVFKMITIDFLTIAAISAVLFYLFLRLLAPELDQRESLSSSLIFAITASLFSPTVVAVVSKKIEARGIFTNTLKLLSSLYALIPMVGFGLVFIITHPNFLGKLTIGLGVQWWMFANAVGIILGFMMVLLTVQKCSEDERLLLIIGFVMLVGGLCYYIKLSSLYTSMLMGIVVANYSRRYDQIFKQLIQQEKTIFIVFLVMVGSMVDFGSSLIWPALFFYILLRLILKTFLSGRIMLRCFPAFRGMGSKCSLVFIGQGGMALAMALDYGLSSGVDISGVVVSVIALAVIMNEIAGFFLAKVGLEACGEVQKV